MSYYWGFGAASSFFVDGQAYQAERSHRCSQVAPHQGSQAVAHQGSPAAAHRGNQAAVRQGSRAAVHQDSRAVALQDNQEAVHQGNRVAVRQGSRVAALQDIRAVALQDTQEAGHQGNQAVALQDSRAAVRQDTQVVLRQGNQAAAHQQLTCVEAALLSEQCWMLASEPVLLGRASDLALAPAQSAHSSQDPHCRRERRSADRPPGRLFELTRCRRAYSRPAGSRREGFGDFVLPAYQDLGASAIAHQRGAHSH